MPKVKFVNKIGVPMVLNPQEIEPTFLKIDFVVAGSGFNSYYYLQCIELDEKRKKERKTLSFMHAKNILRIFKNGFNPVLGLILRLPKIGLDLYLALIVFWLLSNS